MEEVRYLYSVFPRRVITEIKNAKQPIRSSQSLLLTMEEVKMCLQKGAVYRRFPDKNEKVTLMNLERLHNQNFISEEDFKKGSVDMRGTVIDAKGEDTTKIEESGDDQEPQGAEESVVPTAEPESTSPAVAEEDEATPDNKEIKEESTAEESSSDDAKDSEAVDESSDATVVENNKQQNQQQTNYKKKKH